MVASNGNDDLDLDGNWAIGSEDPPAEKRVKKGSKRKLSQAAEPQEASTVVTSGAKKQKKRKKGGAVLEAVLNSEKPPDTRAGEQALKQWALTRLETSWAAEVKASKLTPLESRDMQPLASWFVPSPPDVSLGKLPSALTAKSAQAAVFPAHETLRAFAAGKKPPAAPARGISVLVLCTSTGRVFEAKEEIEKSWNAKALALAAHGGGRRKDQVSRQAKALAEGAAVAVATPARLLRLLAEGHVDASSLALVVLDLAKDSKQRDVLTLNETRGDLFKLLRGSLNPLLCSQTSGASDGFALVLCGTKSTSALA